MVLNLEQIKQITLGTAEIIQDDDKISFNRFTAEQSEAYKQFRSNEFYYKTFAAAGVRMAFRTDSRNLSFEYKFSYGSSRLFGWFDVYVNDIMTEHFGGEGRLFTADRASVSLSEGEKKVEIYFPWSKAVSVSHFELDDGSLLIPVKRSRTMMSFGDSITHGYDAVFPSLSYTSQLAKLLDADLYNKAVGGDTFFPELLYAQDSADPDLITVAYGTNDWNVHTRERFIVSCGAFVEKISKKYPSANIFAITPIWRADNDRETPFGSPHTAVGELIRSLCADFPNITVIDGIALAPHCSDFYSDHYLHPNDLGFCIYARNLYSEIQKYLSASTTGCINYGPYQPRVDKKPIKP